MMENHDNALDPHNDPRKFDSTGMFHWCAERPIEQGFIVSSASEHYIVVETEATENLDV